MTGLSFNPEAAGTEKVLVDGNQDAVDDIAAHRGRGKVVTLAKQLLNRFSRAKPF